MPRIVRTLITATTLSLIFSSPAFSISDPTRAPKPIKQLSLTPTVGGYLFSGAQSLDPAAIYGLKIGYDHIGASIVDTIGIEGTINQFSTTGKSDGKKADGLLLRADVIYSLNPRTKWVPYVALGAGALMIDRDGTKDNSPIANYGVGVKYFFEDYLAVRADVRHVLVYSNVNTDSNFELSTGLTYFFGKERKKKLPPPPKAKPKASKAVPDIVDETAPVRPTPTLIEKLGAAGAAVLGINLAPPQFLPPT